MALFGADHPLVGGTFSFTDEHPLGWFSLTFARELPNEARRDLPQARQASAIHLEGGPPKPGVTFEGAANSTVYQLISMYDTAHGVYIARPDLPASSTVQDPRGDQYLIMAYVSISLPNLMFLDRIAAWADAGEPRGMYGRIRNLEADRYTAHRTARWRALRPPADAGPQHRRAAVGSPVARHRPRAVRRGPARRRSPGRRRRLVLRLDERALMAKTADSNAGAVMISLRRIVRMLRLADRGVQATHGLSAAQLFVLHNLATAPASSVADLAALTFTDQSSVSTVVSRLVDGGLVVRAVSATDKRRVELSLTAAGRAAARGATELPQTKIVDAVRTMSPTRQVEIVRALGALSTAIGADEIDARMLFEDEPKRPRTKRR